MNLGSGVWGTKTDGVFGKTKGKGPVRARKAERTRGAVDGNFGVREVERVDDFSINHETSLSDKWEWVWNLRTVRKIQKSLQSRGGGDMR